VKRLLPAASLIFGIGSTAVAAPHAPQTGAEVELRRLQAWDEAMLAVVGRKDTLGGLERELSGLYLELVPSLVEVRTKWKREDGVFEIASAGVVLTEDGLVVAPVFRDPGRAGAATTDGMQVEVRRVDGARYAATILARNDDYGIALIKVDGLRGMQPKLFPGEWMPEGAPVIALGNAFGLEASMSVGLLTGRARYAGPARRLLQITNPVNPGDGGGLLASARGEVIGMLLTALPELAEAGVTVGVERMMDDGSEGLAQGDRSRALRAEGIGFAVPIEIVASLFPEQLGELMKRKRMLGVQVTSRLMVVETAVGPERRWVVEVQSVLPDSAAAAAGVLGSDVLLELDGVALAILEDLGFAMFHAPPRTGLVVLRGGSPLRLELDFGAWTAPLPEFGLPPAPEQSPAPPAPEDGSGDGDGD
jgi:S1-C subfamily serine protease